MSGTIEDHNWRPIDHCVRRTFLLVHSRRQQRYLVDWQWPSRLSDIWLVGVQNLRQELEVELRERQDHFRNLRAFAAVQGLSLDLFRAQKKELHFCLGYGTALRQRHGGSDEFRQHHAVFVRAATEVSGDFAMNFCGST